MADKSVAEKLGIKPGTRVWVSDPHVADLIGELPLGAELTTARPEYPSSKVVLLRAENALALAGLLDALGTDLGVPPAVWIAYPKGNRVDLNRDSIWPILAVRGLRPNGQVAIDEVWSALRFRALRPGEEQFAGGRP